MCDKFNQNYGRIAAATKNVIMKSIHYTTLRGVMTNTGARLHEHIREANFHERVLAGDFYHSPTPIVDKFRDKKYDKYKTGGKWWKERKASCRLPPDFYHGCQSSKKDMSADSVIYNDGFGNDGFRNSISITKEKLCKSSFQKNGNLDEVSLSEKKLKKTSLKPAILVKGLSSPDTLSMEDTLKGAFLKKDTLEKRKYSLDKEEINYSVSESEDATQEPVYTEPINIVQPKKSLKFLKLKEDLSEDEDSYLHSN